MTMASLRINSKKILKKVHAQFKKSIFRDHEEEFIKNWVKTISYMHKNDLIGLSAWDEPPAPWFGLMSLLNDVFTVCRMFVKKWEINKPLKSTNTPRPISWNITSPLNQSPSNEKKGLNGVSRCPGNYKSFDIYCRDNFTR